MIFHLRALYMIIFAIFSLLPHEVYAKTIPGEWDSVRLSGMTVDENGMYQIARKTDNSGILQMKIGGQWKTVAWQGLSYSAVNVACTELGYPKGNNNKRESASPAPGLWPRDEYVQNVNCDWGVENLNRCSFDWARRSHVGLLQAVKVTCGDKLPERLLENPEKMVGGLRMDNEGLPIIETWDGKRFSLVGPTREDVYWLNRHAREMGYLLFEGYRRGTAFEVLSWDSFRRGTPVYEMVVRPPIVEGEHTALVVRLTVNGLVPDATQDQIRSEIFNSEGQDQWNINLFEKCSHGLFKIVPFTGRYAGLFDTNGGVMDFQIGEVDMKSYTENSSFGTEVEWLAHVASTRFPYDDSVDFILFVLPDGSANWGFARAFAAISGRYSIYDDLSILNPFVVGHEIGHNLGLRHSADVADTFDMRYGDHTCLMGNGYVDDDLERDFDEYAHCFNSAKNWQLGWFGDRRAQWSPSDGLKTFDLVGLGDYAFSIDKQVIALEIESQGVNCYLGFNRVSGVSEGVKEYQDLVTLQCVHDGMSYLLAHLDSGDWAADINALEFNLDYAVYVEAIEIKPEGHASIARIILGSRTDVLNNNEANSRPVNCIINATKSAARCTEQCGFVPGVPKDDYPPLRGGSCADYECSIYDGECAVGGKCPDQVLEPLIAGASSLIFNETYHFCEKWLQWPQHLFSNATCILSPTWCSHNFCELLMSDWHAFCTYDFSSQAPVDEVEKQMKITFTYSVRTTLDDSSTELSSATIARNFADLVGEDSVVVNIDDVSNIIEVIIATKQHSDLEDRLKHKWFLDRLREKLEYDQIFVDLDKLEFTESNIGGNQSVDTQDEDESILDKILANHMVLVGAISGAFMLMFAIICVCYYCGRSRAQKKRNYVINV